MSNSPHCKQYIMHFDSHLRYGCQIWGQRRNEYIESIEKTQNKAIRILKLFRVKRARKELKISTKNQK